MEELREVKEIYSDVVSKTKDSYSGDFHGDLMEQYKIIRSSIIDIQNDRNTNNRFMLGLSSALVAVAALILHSLPQSNVSEPSALLSWLLLIVPLAGLGTSYIWIRWNMSYCKAIRVRYALIKGVEEHLPAQPFTKETGLREDIRYKPISHLQVQMASIFFVVQVFILVVLVFNLCKTLTG